MVEQQSLHPTPTTELAKAQTDSAPGQQIMPAVVESVLGSLGGMSLTNFTGDALAKWRMTAIACGPDVISGSDALNQEINVRYFYAHKLQIVNPDNGEINDAIRCVLMESDMTAYGFVSDGIARDLAQLIQMFGMGPYDPAIRVKVVPIKTRRGRTTYSIVPA